MVDESITRFQVKQYALNTGRWRDSTLVVDHEKMVSDTAICYLRDLRGIMTAYDLNIIPELCVGTKYYFTLVVTKKCDYTMLHFSTDARHDRFNILHQIFHKFPLPGSQARWVKVDDPFVYDVNDPEFFMDHQESNDTKRDLRRRITWVLFDSDKCAQNQSAMISGSRGRTGDTIMSTQMSRSDRGPRCSAPTELTDILPECRTNGPNSPMRQRSQCGNRVSFMNQMSPSTSRRQSHMMQLQGGNHGNHGNHGMHSPPAQRQRWNTHHAHNQGPTPIRIPAGSSHHAHGYPDMGYPDMGSPTSRAEHVHVLGAVKADLKGIAQKLTQERKRLDMEGANLEQAGRDLARKNEALKRAENMLSVQRENLRIGTLKLQEAEAQFEIKCSGSKLDDCMRYQVQRHSDTDGVQSRWLFLLENAVVDDEKLISSYHHIRKISVGKSYKVLQQEQKQMQRDQAVACHPERATRYHFTLVYSKGSSGHDLWASDFSVERKEDRYQILMKIITKLPDIQQNRMAKCQIEELNDYADKEVILDVVPACM